MLPALKDFVNIVNTTLELMSCMSNIVGEGSTASMRLFLAETRCPIAISLTTAGSTEWLCRGHQAAGGEGKS